jgi:hypothetical protein
MTLKMKGDPKRLEEIAAQDPDRVRAISDKALEAGVIAHRFYGSDDGQIMVIDEWPDAESFHGFFQDQAPNIQPLMQDSGVEGEPEVTIWNKLETHDDVGWGS